VVVQGSSFHERSFLCMEIEEKHGMCCGYAMFSGVRVGRQWERGLL